MNPINQSVEQEIAGPDLVGLIQGAALAQAVCVAAELRIADLIAGGTNDIGDLAKATRSHRPSLHRLLRGLASLGLCRESEDGTFELTPTGLLLRTDAPDSLRPWLLWFGKYQWPTWGRLLHSVQTGESARALVPGAAGFGLMETDPQAASLFNETMVQLTRAVAAEVVQAFDFDGMRHVVDVGGGYGTLLAAILQAHPHLRGAIFDMPHAIAGARQQFEKSGLADRCEMIAGDFFQSIPPGADAYVLKNIIHDWDDERSNAILGNCRRAIPVSGRLLIIERVMPTRVLDAPEHRAIAYADLAMLIGPGGRERTAIELSFMLENAGFLLAREIETQSGFSILEAVPR